MPGQLGSQLGAGGIYQADPDYGGGWGWRCGWVVVAVPGGPWGDHPSQGQVPEDRKCQGDDLLLPSN